MQEVNWWTLIVTPILAGTVMFLVTRMGKGFDARGQAEAALLGLGPQIVAEQNKRLEMLESQMSTSWERERECWKRLDVALARIEQLERKVL